MFTLERVGTRYAVAKYTQAKLKGELVFKEMCNNALDAVQALIQYGLSEEMVSAAYTAMHRRGFTKAYFSHKGNLIYLKGDINHVKRRDPSSYN